MINLQRLARNLAAADPRVAEGVNRFIDFQVSEVKSLATRKVERQGFPLTEKQTLFYGSWLRELNQQRV